MITGSNPIQKDIFLKKLELHMKHGIKLVQLRAKEIAKADYIDLAKSAIEMGKKFNSKVILNADMALVDHLGADGVHLTSQVLMDLQERPLANKIVAASCHNLDQLKHAEMIGVDLVTLSPIQDTTSHPDAIPLGWTQFSGLCKSISLPVYALGGIKAHDLERVMSCGAFGIAAISSLWDREYL